MEKIAEFTITKQDNESKHKGYFDEAILIADDDGSSIVKVTNYFSKNLLAGVINCIKTKDDKYLIKLYSEVEAKEKNKFKIWKK